MGISLNCGSGITEGLLLIIHLAISPPISLSLSQERDEAKDQSVGQGRAKVSELQWTISPPSSLLRVCQMPKPHQSPQLTMSPPLSHSM